MQVLIIPLRGGVAQRAGVVNNRAAIHLRLCFC